MAAWTVLLRGIGYRKGRSALVLILATIATAAAVLVPAYSRAAQQSVLSDGLRAAPDSSTDLVVSAAGANGALGSIDDVKVAVNRAVLENPVVRRYLGKGIGAVDTETATTLGGAPVAAKLAYREGACAHLRVTGQCPIEPGDVLVSARSAAAHHIGIGGTLTLRLGAGAGAKTVRSTVVGTYTVPDAADTYWANTAYFTATAGTDSTAERIDTVFTAAEDDVTPSAAVPTDLTVAYPLDTTALRLSDVGALRAQLDRMGLDLRAAGGELDTALPDALDGIGADQAAISRTVPIIGVPLVLLCWFVLFLLVASLIEERGPEVALAKLRGFDAGRTRTFGLGEALLLIAVGAPAGCLVGLAVVEVAARFGLAPGTHAEARWPVFVAAGLSLLAGAAAAVLAGRRTLASPVLALLRRVPERSRWTAGVVEGVVVALAAASLLAATTDGAGPLALIAPALIALVAGIAAARVLGLWSRARLALARRRGRVVSLLAAASLARRPGLARIVMVVTVAVALLSFAATAWDVAAQARQDNAVDTVGAARVYTVSAGTPEAVEAAVASADTSGNSMAVLRTTQRYGDGIVQLLGVQSQRFATVASWRGHPAGAEATDAALLRPAAAPPLALRGSLAVEATVGDLGDHPVRMAALLSAPGRPPWTVFLGMLDTGPHTYRATLSDCSGGCTLLGLGFGRPAGGSATIAATVLVHQISDSGGTLDAGLADAARWRLDASAAGHSSVRAGGGLAIDVSSSDPGDVVVDYVDVPAALPAVLAGGAPAGDRNATSFTFPALTDQPQPFTVVDHAAALPRVGTSGLLVDFDYALRAARRYGSITDNGSLRYEVWADSAAPADLDQRLEQAGLQVTSEQTIGGYARDLARRAPALGLRLYLLAGVAAILLAMGAVLLSVYIGADSRLYEMAALRVAGVHARTIRRALLREYRSLLGAPLVVGFLAGVGGAALMLPGIPLVTVGGPVGDVTYHPGLGALPGAVLLIVLALLLVVATAVRMSGRARPERLREGIR